MNEEEDEDEIPFVKPEISIEECRAILCSDGEQYTDKEIEEARTFLLVLVEIDYRYHYKQWKQIQVEAKVIDLTKQEDKTNDKAA